MMAAPTLNELLALDVQTRLALVQELWDSIVKDAQSGVELPVSDAERKELEDRIREDDDDPDAAIPWSDARARLRRQ
jgi:putative addiction module component (TIGR02574 family)